MTQALHSQARTTHLIREEIRNSTLSQAELARLYNVTRQTIRKWQNRDTPEDKSHAPNTMYTTLTPEQELIVVELRKTLLLPTDDLLAVTREFINAAVSRASLGRCLRRHGVSDLRDLVEQEGAAPATKKTFKDYEPGFVHIDIKYLPQMPDETARRYLFVAIDRATRWVFIELYADQTDGSSVDFLTKVQQACPVKIVKLLTDNGSQFTDRLRLAARRRKPAARMCSTGCARSSASSTALFRLAIRKPTVWWSASTAASATSSTRLDSAQLPNWNRHCAITSRSTTTAFRSERSSIKHPFRHSRNGMRNALNYSGNASITRRVLTTNKVSRQ